MSALSPASLTLSALRARGEPDLFERDPKVWTERLVTWFETASGRTLYPDQTEMFLIEMLAYIMALHGESAQNAVIQNLAVWAEDRNLDDVAAFLSIFRLTAQKAETRFRFTLPAALAREVVVPIGTVIALDDIRFATTERAVIAAGQLTAEADAQALSPGTAANGFGPGRIKGQLGSIAAGLSAQNITATASGTDAETDDHLRESVVDAAEGFDRRGGWGGYGLFVRRVSPAIAEVAVDRPQPGHIHIVPMISGDTPPSAALLATIAAALDPETVTPQGDFVTVRAPSPTDFTFTVRLKIDANADPDAIKASAEKAVRAAFAAMRRPLLSGSRRTQFAPETGRLGAQVAPGPMVAAAMVPGVIDATIEGLVFTDLAFDRYPRLASLTVIATAAPDV